MATGSTKRNPSSKNSLLRKTSLSLTFLVFVLGFSALGAADTGISSCSDADANISTSGVYNITSNSLDASGAGTACINVSASDVVIDGLGNTIDGKETDTTHVYVNGESGSKISNVTVKNLTVKNSTKIYGVGVDFDYADNSTVKNITSIENYIDVRLSDSEDVNITNSTFRRATQTSVFFSGSSNRLNITDLSIINASRGIDGINSKGVEVHDTDITGVRQAIYDVSSKNFLLSNVSLNPGTETYSLIEPNDQSVTEIEGRNVTMNDTEIDFVTRGAVINTSLDQSHSSELRGIGKFIQASNQTSNDYLEINFTYSGSDVTGFDEPGLDIYRKSGGSFSTVSSSKVYPSKNKVYANITSFSNFGVLDNKYDIEGCQTVDYSGVLNVKSDIKNSSAEPCINVKSSDVRIEGNDHLLNGGSDTNGLKNAGIFSESSVINLTVKNLELKNWYFGVKLFSSGMDDVNLTDIYSHDSYDGARLETKGISIIGGNYSDNTDDGLDINHRGDLHAEDVIASHQSGDGLVIEQSGGNRATLTNLTLNNNDRGLDANKNFGEFKLNVTNSTAYSNQKSGFEIYGVNSTYIISNNLTDNNRNANSKDAGIEINNSDNLVIEDNYLYNNTNHGIRLRYTNNTEILSNDVLSGYAAEEGTEGISIGDKDPLRTVNFTVKNNNISENGGYGIQAYSENSTYFNNTVLSNGYGSPTYSSGIYLKEGDNLNVTSNTIEKNEAEGLLLRKSNSSTVEDNYFNGTSTSTTNYPSITLNTVSHSQVNGNTIYNLIGSGIRFYKDVNKTDVKQNDLETSGPALELSVPSNSYEIKNNVIRNNSALDSESFVEFGSQNLNDRVKGLEVFSGLEINVTGQRFNLSDNSSSIPALPGQNFSIVEFNASNKTGSNEWMQLNVSYSESVAKDINESTLSLYHYNQSGGQWEEVSETGVDVSDNRVYGNVTEFSPVAVFGEGEPDITTSGDGSFSDTSTDSSSTKTITVKNSGKVNLTLTKTKITGDTGQFSIKSGDVTSDTNVTTSGSYSIKVKFSPDSDKDYSGTLKIYSDDPDEDPKTVNLSGTGTSSGSGGGGGGGGSGGGGGGGSFGSVSLPAKSQVFFDVAKGSSAEVDIENPMKYGVVSVNVTVSTAKDKFEISVKKQRGKPANVSTPSGQVFNYMNIEAEDLEDSEISSATIDFVVNKSWVSQNNIKLDTVELRRYSDGSWNPLETRRTGENSSVYTFESDTPAFSYFAVSGEEEQQQQEDQGQQVNETQEQTSDQTSDEEEKSSNQTADQDQRPEQESGSLIGGLLPFLLLIVLVAGAAAVYLNREELMERLEQDEGREEEISIEDGF